MATATVSDQPKTVRTVLYFSPQTASYIRAFPQRKRSQAVERMIRYEMEHQEKKEAIDALYRLREKFKGQGTTKQAVEWIRKYRQSH